MATTVRFSSVVRLIDRALTQAYLAILGEGGGLVSFLLHGLVEDGDAEAPRVLFAPQAFAVSQLRQLLACFADCGYKFVSPQDILNGLDPSGRYFLLSFDDGYYNNRLALPLLEEFKAPAVFYISSNHVRHGKAFWWDVVWRRRLAQGDPPAQIGDEIARYAQFKTSEIEEDLRRQFGDQALTPVGDVDRPFTPAELNEFARNSFVHLGNHTADHAILSNYPPEEVRQQIATCQADLAEMAGVQATSIAYPNGVYNQQAMDTAREVGLKLGVAVDLRRNRLPINAHDIMCIGRFVLKHDADVEPQCQASRSSVSLYRSLQHLMMRFRGHNTRGAA